MVTQTNDPMGILKVADGWVGSRARALVTQTNDPMGILKVLLLAPGGWSHSRYTDQRSDGDTDSCAAPDVGCLRASVTQTNDPMGILKVIRVQAHADLTESYTDQRSDGDTERELAICVLVGEVVLHRPTIRWGY